VPKAVVQVAPAIGFGDHGDYDHRLARSRIAPRSRHHGGRSAFPNPSGSLLVKCGQSCKYPRVTVIYARTITLSGNLIQDRVTPELSWARSARRDVSVDCERMEGRRVFTTYRPEGG
jgi:hypothetical protein